MHRAATGLSHVGDQGSADAGLVHPRAQIDDELNQFGMAVIAIATEPDRLIAKPLRRQLLRTVDTAIGIGSDRFRHPGGRVTNGVPGDFLGEDR